MPYRSMTVLLAYLFLVYLPMHYFGARITAAPFGGALGKAIAAPPEGKGFGCAVWATSPEQ